MLRLADATAQALLHTLTQRMDGGTLAYYSGERPNHAEELVVILAMLDAL